MSTTKALSQFITNLTLESFPHEVIQKAKLLIIDNIACIIGSLNTQFGRFILSLSSVFKNVSESSVFGTRKKYPSHISAFLNSMLANAMDYDDTGAGGHSGSTVVPAAFAISEKVDVSGTKLLASVITGYEVAERIGEAIQPSWRRYKKVHGKSHQTLGATAACDKVLNLDEEKTMNSLGLACAFSPVPCDGKFGLTERPITWVKDNVSWCSLAGILAAEFAAKGFIGSRTVLDGDAGYWAMICSDRFDERKLLNPTFRVLRVSFKPYPCCRWLHSTLDALEKLVDDKLAPNNVKRITIRSIEEFTTGFADYNVINMLDAEFSLPYVVAMVIYRIPRHEWYCDKVFYDKDIRRFMKKVRIEADETYSVRFRKYRRRYFADYVPTKVIVELKDGSSFQEHREFARGSPWNPMTYEEVKAKALELFNTCLDVTDSKIYWDKLINIEKVENIKEFIGELASSIEEA